MAKCVLMGERSSIAVKFNNLTGTNFPGDLFGLVEYRTELAKSCGRPGIFKDGVQIDLVNLHTRRIYGSYKLGSIEPPPRIRSESVGGPLGGFANLYKRYPRKIAEKYSQYDPRDSTRWRTQGFRYVGPEVKTSVDSWGPSECAVVDMSNGDLTQTFSAERKGSAFASATLFAESRGLPWKAGIEPNLEIFDPATGRLWSNILY
jgi:hypothetical protein